MLLSGPRCTGNRAGSRRSLLAQSPLLKNTHTTPPADTQRTGDSGDFGPEKVQLTSTCLESGQNGIPGPVSLLSSLLG